MIAAVLGILGAVLNFAYLRTKSQQFEAEYFIGVERTSNSGDAALIARGDRLLKSDLKKVPVPKGRVGEIRNFAIPWSARKTVEGEPVWRAISEPRLLWNDDLKTPPQELDIREGEMDIGVTIDTRTCVPSLIQPGQLVSFIIPRTRGGMTTDAGSAGLVAPFGPSKPGDAALDDNTTSSEALGDENVDRAAKPLGSTVIIGPFRVISVGNRLGSADVMRAARLRQLQENVMRIAIPVTKDGDIAEKKAQLLIDMLYATNFRQVGVMMHSPKKQ